MVICSYRGMSKNRLVWIGEPAVSNKFKGSRRPRPEAQQRALLGALACHAANATESVGGAARMWRLHRARAASRSEC